MVKAPHLQWLGYELRRLGRLGLAMPALVALAFTVVAGLMHLAGAEDQQVARALTAGLELGLSLVAGLVAVDVAVSDPAVDLQLTLRTRYRTTLFRRLALLVGWTGLFALLWASALNLLGLWAVPGSFLLGQLAWIAPLSWFVSVGVLLSLAFRSRAVSVAVLGLLWGFENTPVGVASFLQSDWLRPFFLFTTTHAPGADYWFSNRMAVICVSLALFCLSMVLLKKESLSTGGEA